jgi:hypothetical protein
MRELNAETRRAGVPPGCSKGARQGCFVAVGIETKAAMADPPPPLDCCRLDHYEARAGESEGAQMLQMPVRGRAVLGAVLAHRCDHETVRQFETSKLQWGKELAGHDDHSIRGSV